MDSFSLPWGGCSIYRKKPNRTGVQHLPCWMMGGCCVIRISQGTPHSSTITTAIPSYKFSFPSTPHGESGHSERKFVFQIIFYGETASYLGRATNPPNEGEFLGRNLWQSEEGGFSGEGDPQQFTYFHQIGGCKIRTLHFTQILFCVGD